MQCRWKCDSGQINGWQRSQGREETSALREDLNWSRLDGAPMRLAPPDGLYDSETHLWEMIGRIAMNKDPI
jgi:hypothetical protein